MGTPHVCFADELQQDQMERNGNYNNNNGTGSCTKKWLLELEPTTSSSLGGHSPSSTLSISPTPRYERNMGFFQQLSRRFGLRSSDDLVHGGSDDAATGHCTAAQEDDANSSSTDSYSSSMAAGRGLAAARLELMSCASSETSSTIDIEEQQLEQQQLQLQLQDKQQQLQNGKRKSMSRTSFSRLHRRSTSSLRRAFESLSLTSRSLSCSGPSPPPSAPPTAPLNQATGTSLPLKSALKSASTVDLHHRHQHRLASKSASSSSACSTSSSTSTTTTTTTSTAAATTKSKSKPPPQRILRQPVSYTYLKGMSGLPTQRVPRSSVCCQYARR